MAWSYRVPNLQKVYGNAQSFRTQKVLIAAKIAKKDVEVVSGNPPAEKFPLGTVGACPLTSKNCCFRHQLLRTGLRLSSVPAPLPNT